jgi:hypothetical protein
MTAGERSVLHDEATLTLLALALQVQRLPQRLHHRFRFAGFLTL